MPKTILVALDLDDTADVVLDTAVTYAQALGARLVLAHVVPELAIAFPEARIASDAFPAGQKQEPLLVSAARERLDQLAVRCADADLVTHEVVSHGDPAATLLDLMQSWNADLLVVGTHGRKGLARVLVGSVCEAILRRAEAPVLVVRTGEHP